MITHRLGTFSISQQPMLSHLFQVAALIFLIAIVDQSSSEASHISASSTQTTSAASSAATQTTKKPTKPGATVTTSAATAGLDASVVGFNIQSFQADLFTGSAGAEIPILVPPGAAGIAPKILLNYNSGVVDDMGNNSERDQADWVGLGWSLDSGGFIVRDTKGTTGTSDDSFKLVFGGHTYDLVSIGSGSYRTKDETFWQITYFSSGDYWTLRTKDGTTHRFGYTSNSRATGLTFALNKEVPVTFRYFIDEVSTTSGVSVRYSYFKQSSSYNNKAYDQAVYPDTITYAYYAGSLVGNSRTVTFIRGNRTDWTDVSGSQHTSYHELYRLDAVEVRIGTSLVRKYNFGYDYSIDRDPNHTWGGGAAGDLTLTSVTPIGSDGTSALPPRSFTYVGTVLASATNGIGGSVSFAYEEIKSLYSVWYEDFNSNCVFSGLTDTRTDTECQWTSHGVVLTSSAAGTLPLYDVWNEDFNSNCIFAGLSSSGPGNCGGSLHGYPYTSNVLDAVALYDVWDEDFNSNCDFVGFSTSGPGNCGGSLHGYVRPGEVDRTRHRVISRTMSDGLGWSSTTNFTYYNPAVNADRKEFRGHAKVRAIDPIGNYTDTWFYQDDIKKGRPYQIETRSAAGALYNKVVNTFTTSNPYTGVTFVALTRTDYFECEGQATCHQNAETFTYDTNGNPTQKNDLGDVATTGDERTEVTEWIVDSANWIHRPKRTALLDNTGATVRERWIYYDNAAYGALGTRGLVTKEESRLAGNIGNAGNPTVTYSYDAYGNRTSVTDARSCTTSTVFESSQTFPSTVTNCLNHQSTMAYDERFGVMTSQTDANNQTMTSTYDVFGRVTKVTGPLDGSSTYGTVSTFYLNWGNPSLQRVTTYRTEQHGTANYIWSEAYFDGLGRNYQSAQEGPGGQAIVSETQFDGRGLQWKTSAPRFTTETAVWTEFLYDVLGRQTRVNFPDGTNAQTAYDHHEFIATDPRGKVKRTYTDSHHRVIQVEEVNGGASYFTTYQYDAADSLIKVTNNAGHNTLNAYDYLGRKIAMCDPNMGTASSLTTCSTSTPGAWVYTYNLAGDLLTQKDAKNQTLTFTYDSVGRPLTKKQGTVSLVTWTYDDPTVPYSKGRVTQIVDQATTTKFAYDQLGRTTQTQRQLLGRVADDGAEL